MKNEKFNAELLKKLTDHTFESAGLPKELLTHYQPSDGWSSIGEEVNESMMDLVSAVDFAEPVHRAAKRAMDYNEALRHAPTQALLNATFASVHKETIVHHLLLSLNRIPTSQSTYRILDFIMATTPQVSPLSAPPGESIIELINTYASMDEEKLAAQLNTDKMLREINDLLLVSKATLIMNDYPETITISIKMFSSPNQSETEDTITKLDEIIAKYKPQGLIELEALITNKVVY